MNENNQFETMNKEEAQPMEQVSGTVNWHADEFEAQFKQQAPKPQSLAVYRPKPKRVRKLFKSSIFAAVISSLITCCLCLGIFSAYYRLPQGTPPVSVLP